MDGTLDYFEMQGRTAVQLAEELFALADEPREELVKWSVGLNWHEKRLAEAVMRTAAEMWRRRGALAHDED